MGNSIAFQIQCLVCCQARSSGLSARSFSFDHKLQLTVTHCLRSKFSDRHTVPNGSIRHSSPSHNHTLGLIDQVYIQLLNFKLLSSWKSRKIMVGWVDCTVVLRVLHEFDLSKDFFKNFQETLLQQ